MPNNLFDKLDMPYFLSVIECKPRPDYTFTYFVFRTFTIYQRSRTISAKDIATILPTTWEKQKIKIIL